MSARSQGSARSPVFPALTYGQSVPCTPPSCRFRSRPWSDKFLRFSDPDSARSHPPRTAVLRLTWGDTPCCLNVTPGCGKTAHWPPPRFPWSLTPGSQHPKHSASVWSCSDPSVDSQSAQTTAAHAPSDVSVQILQVHFWLRSPSASGGRFCVPLHCFFSWSEWRFLTHGSWSPHSFSSSSLPVRSTGFQSERCLSRSR